MKYSKITLQSSYICLTSIKQILSKCIFPPKWHKTKHSPETHIEFEESVSIALVVLVSANVSPHNMFVSPWIWTTAVGPQVHWGKWTQCNTILLLICLFPYSWAVNNNYFHCQLFCQFVFFLEKLISCFVCSIPNPFLAVPRLSLECDLNWIHTDVVQSRPSDSNQVLKWLLSHLQCNTLWPLWKSRKSSQFRSWN